MSTKRFDGKVAVVTGGNSGIGLGAAKAFASEGAQVVITGRDEKTLQAAAKEIGPGTLAIRSDAAKLSDIDDAMGQIKKNFGRIDALFVNAGVGRFIPIEQVTETFFDDTFNVNVKGVLFTVQKALPLMRSGSSKHSLNTPCPTIPDAPTKTIFIVPFYSTQVFRSIILKNILKYI